LQGWNDSGFCDMLFAVSQAMIGKSMASEIAAIVSQHQEKKTVDR
jgi:hypothetical protein